LFSQRLGRRGNSKARYGSIWSKAGQVDDGINMIKELIKIANELDERRLFAEANELDLLMEVFQDHALGQSSEEDWRTKTDWKKGEDHVTLGDVVDYLDQISVEAGPLSISYLLEEGMVGPIIEPHRVKDTNLDFPVIIVKGGGKYQYILDGNHRFEKARKDGRDTISARVLDLDNSEIPKKFKRVFGN